MRCMRACTFAVSTARNRRLPCMRTLRIVVVRIHARAFPVVASTITTVKWRNCKVCFTIFAPFVPFNARIALFESQNEVPLRLRDRHDR